jgi:2-phospho-L-lactate/phosphoenolpyruvate guanylyltransferase
VKRPLRWAAVVPLKRFDLAKSRLDGAREALARAFALDTLAAVTAVPEVEFVVVVTDEPEFEAPSADVRVIRQRRPGLNGAILDGIDRVRAETRDTGIAILLGDLPALTASVLTSVLHAAAAHSTGFVPDAQGTGTTIVTALEGNAPLPSFGAGSAASHEASGHARLDAPERARRDVDTDADLRVAVALGVGRHTAAVLGA